MKPMLGCCLRRFWSVGVAALIAIAAAGGAPAHAEFAISPLRQVITAESPEATFMISNPSARRLEARIRWIDLQAEDEGYRPASPELRDRLSAARYLTVTPSALTLGPGERAAIRIALRADRNPGPGERRSHLLIETDAVRTPLRNAGGGMQADIGLGVSAPVILRAGSGAAGAAIGDTRLTRLGDGLLALETAVLPKGAFSAFGRLAVRFRAAGETRERALGTVRNVAAYADAPLRLVTVALGREHLPQGRMTVRYEGEGEFAGQVFAERVFSIAAPPPGDDSGS
ncbi:MAG: hypothetical protein AAGC56_05285 [Pseudomonadota bacterium]